MLLKKIKHLTTNYIKHSYFAVFKHSYYNCRNDKIKSPEFLSFQNFHLLDDVVTVINIS